MPNDTLDKIEARWMKTAPFTLADRKPILAGFGFGCAICGFINVGLFVFYRERPPAQEQKR